MRETGFGPAQALSHKSLNLARLTTPAPPHVFLKILVYKKFYKCLWTENFEDGHSKREIPGLIPNPEVKPFTLMVLVSKRS